LYRQTVFLYSAAQKASIIRVLPRINQQTGPH
jgi:hypothetical protein